MTSKFNGNLQTATLILPPNATNVQKRAIPCTYLSRAGNRLALEACERIACSSPVSIEYNDAMFLGEVVHAVRSEDETWILDIRVEHVLRGLKDLVKLRSQLLGAEAGAATAARIGV